MKQSHSKTGVLGLSFLLMAAALVTCPLVGSTGLALENILKALKGLDGGADAQVLFTLRLPRVLLAAAAGAAMSMAGLVFQAILRNPLACPFTLGVAGGSSLGAVTAIALGVPPLFLGLSSISLFAFLGALSAVVLVWALASLIRSFSAVTLLLAGITVNSFFNAVILFFYYTSDFTQSYSMLHWMLGSLDVTDSRAVGRIFLILAAGLLALLALARDLNLFSAGEELARSKGVPTRWVAAWGFLLASLLTSSVVALTGPIGFVGLIVPHAYRLFAGNDHRILLPACALGGGAFLVACDTAARSFFGAGELPVGVLTALIGAPFFLWMLFERRKHFRGE